MPGPARILVVDDEARIADVVQGYLDGQGHTVERAATGEEVLAAVRLVCTVCGRGHVSAEGQP